MAYFTYPLAYTEVVAEFAAEGGVVDAEATFGLRDGVGREQRVLAGTGHGATQNERMCFPSGRVVGGPALLRLWGAKGLTK